MSEMTNMNVNRAEMTKAAGQVEDRASQIHGIQKTLNDRINALMVGWTGNAAQAFLRAYQGFDERFVEVHNQLDRIHERLVGTQLDYTRTEEENAASTNQVANLLNEL